jgi:sodium pump decarboxylase gamma subunit
MGELTLLQKFADPALIDQLSGVDKTTGALVTTMMGMGITFIVLSLLWGLIAIMTKVLDAQEKRHLAAASISEAMVESAIASNPKLQPVAQETDDFELIAVITAALAASLNQPANNLVISKIRRLAGNSTAWSQAGSNDIIASRRI